MAKSKNKQFLKRLPRLKQKTNAHCGPAVLSMLYRFWGKNISQDLIVETAKIGKTLRTRGMTVFDMAETAAQLTPEYVFWFKQNTTVEEVAGIIQRHRLPVGVEWQGIFGKYSDGDDGHYSIITHIDRDRDKIYIADPFRVFAGQDRELKISEFARRWWDENEIRVKGKKKKTIRDRQMSFLIVPRRRRFPKNLNMQKIV